MPNSAYKYNVICKQLAADGVEYSLHMRERERAREYTQFPDIVSFFGILHIQGFMVINYNGFIENMIMKIL